MQGQTTSGDRSTLFSAPNAFAGNVIRPGDATYDEARRVWNGMVDRHPAAIVQCRDASEVQATVLAARAQQLSIAVRGGGHNAAGLAVCDDGVVIDLSLMRAVTVDANARTARVEGGARWVDLDAATQAHGLATTGGAISSTGVAGLTLGGGIGWLMRRQGLACDNVIAFELVTADGRLVTASAEQNAELFWGLRGGGGNFGIVTAFTFQLQPLGGVVAGMLIHPLPAAKDVIRFVRNATALAPDDLTVFVALMTSPEGLKVAAVVPVWTGAPEDADAALAPLRAFGPPVADTVGPMSYVALQQMLDGGFPDGLQVYWRGEFLSALTDDAIDALVDQLASATSPLSAIVIEQLGGAMSRVPVDATAFPHRDAAYNLALIGRWIEPAERDQHVAWVRATHDAVRPFARGTYVNYLGLGEGAERVRDAYGPETWARLVSLKNAWDPDNVFRLNQNIPPG